MSDLRRRPFRAQFPVDHEPFDLVVVGAGITGVQVAREAAVRGLRVALFDRGDLGGGTSSATTKYLHGGIRYLEQREFGVVRESLRERRILSLGAPHLVRPRRFLMPGWRWSTPSTPMIGLGVAAYTAMGRGHDRDAPPGLRLGRPAWVSRRQLLREVPWLRRDGLQGAWAYGDMLNVHPERLLLAYVRDAVALGASVRTHTAVTGFEVEDDSTADRAGGHDAVRVRGVRVVECDSATGVAVGEPSVVRCRGVVNAGGPWIDRVLGPLARADGRTDRPLGIGVARSKGVHLLTRPLGGSASVFCRAPNGSHVIVSPWHDFSFVGPTDTPVDASLDRSDPTLAVEPADVEQILSTVNGTVDSSVRPPVERSDVVDATVGLRPLLDTDGDTYRASRRHELYDHGAVGVHGIWSIGGGKWTTARATAVEALDAVTPHVCPGAARRSSGVDSSTRPAFGSPGWAADPTAFFVAAAADVTGGSGRITPDQRVHLARLYGTAAAEVLERIGAEPRGAERIDPHGSCRDLAAQVSHAVDVEGAADLADIVDRRLVVGTLGPLDDDVLVRVAEAARDSFGWSSAQAADAARAEASRRRAIRSRWESPAAGPS